MKACQASVANTAHNNSSGTLFFNSLCCPLQAVSTHYSMRSATLGAPNKKDYIEELTKQLDSCQKVRVVT